VFFTNVTTSCDRYNLANGDSEYVLAHCYVNPQPIQECKIQPGDTAGFLLARAMPNMTLYWTARLSGGTARYVGKNGSDASDCSAYPTPCKTIAQAVAQAKPGDTVRIGGGTFAGGFTISKSLTLVGNGSGLTTISGGGTGPIVTTAGGTEVRIEGVTIAGARASTGAGGVSNQHADVMVVDSVVKDNQAPSGAGLGNFQDGTITILRSTVTGNSGGFAVSNTGLGDLQVINSTIDGNANGGIQLTGDPGSATLRNSSVTRNLGAAGIANGNPDPVLMANTLLAGNYRSDYPDCEGLVSALPEGHNLIANAPDISCEFDAAGSSGNLIGTPAQHVDPKLGPLRGEGGLTPTVALLTGSPAIGAGAASVCAAGPVGGVDQRGFTRPTDSCDIGAYDTKAVNVPPVG